ncbi:MAG: hypothetical protein MUO89_05385 [Dehalococcoidia bacterium]|nr:hypothetical protein [Dehalococcoidia bacterium]
MFYVANGFPHFMIFFYHIIKSIALSLRQFLACEYNCPFHCKIKTIAIHCCQLVPAWNKVKEVIEHPKMILAELKKRADASRSGNGRIEKEIARIQKRIANNDSQQQRLLTLFGNGGIDESAVVGKLSQLNKEKQELEDQINRLSKSIEQKIDMNAAKEKIEQYCKRVRLNLDKCTLQDKKKALNALDVEIAAIPQEMKIRIVVPLEFITTAQTSA